MAVVAQNQAPSTIIYLDVNSTFGESGLQILVTNLEAINNQLFNLFSTRIGSADYEPELGSLLDNFLFEQNTQSPTWDTMRMNLYNAVNRWMSDRISVNPNSFRIVPDLPNQVVYVTVSYVYLQLGIQVNATVALPVAGSGLRAASLS
jgi:phage baseplate assembly protein W